MRHPSEYWIKYLISQDAHTDEQIQGMCEMANLGAINDTYLINLRMAMMKDRPILFRPRDVQCRASQLFLRKEGIHEAWYRNQHMKTAVNILISSKLRALVETFILSPLKSDQAVRKIREKLDIKLHKSAYELYRHFFWNSNLLSSTDWGDFLRSRELSHHEWLRLAVTAHGPQGIQMLLWKTGTGNLRQLTANRIFEDIRNIAYMKIKEIELRPAHMEHSQTFLNYARAAKIAQEEVANTSDAMKDVLSHFQAFRMQHSEMTTPSIGQLTGGNFSEAEDVAGASDDISY